MNMSGEPAPRSIYASTMADVARYAKVSRATVSRVLSGTAKVSPKTRARVVAATSKLGYVPSAGAQQLAAGKSRTIGLLIRDARNPTYGLLHSQIQRWADEFGLDVVTAIPTYYRGAHREMAALRRLIGMRVGGLLVATGVVRTDDLKQFVPVVPVVSVGRPESDPGIYGVSYDEDDNATQIAHAVYEHGHRCVAVMVPRSENSLAESIRGVVTADVLERLGCDVHRIDVQLLGAEGEGHGELLRLVRSRKVTSAVFPTDHRMLEFVTHARRLGLEVPQDVSVIGCDGVMDGLSYMNLASLRLPVELVGHRAVEVIATMLEDRNKVDIVHETYPGKLQLAGSLGVAGDDVAVKEQG